MDEEKPQESWVDTLPEPLRNAPFLAKAESAEDAFAKITHAANVLGRSVRFPDDKTTPEDREAFYQRILDAAPDVVRLPGDTDDPEAMEAFYARFGVPKESKDYVPGQKENWEWDADYLAELGDMARAAGLNKAQFKRLTEQMAERGVKLDEASEHQVHAENEKIKATWGEAHDANMTLIKNWLSMSEAPESLQDMINAGNLTVDSASWLLSMAKQFVSDDDDNRNKGDTRGGPLTPAEAEEKIQEIMNDPAYFNARDPRHQILKQKMSRLMVAKLAGRD